MIEKSNQRNKTKKGRKSGNYRFIFRKYLFLDIVSCSQAGYSKAFVRNVPIHRHSNTLQEPNTEGAGWPTLL